MTGTILMVDDDPVLLEMYESIFEAEYTVLLADSVKQAIDILSVRDVDAVGCDLHVGVGEGRDVLQWISLNKPELMNMSVLISGDVLTDLSDLAVPILVKPVQVPKLIETFERFFELKRLNPDSLTTK